MLNKEKYQKQLEDILVKTIAVYQDYEEAVEVCCARPCNKCLFFQNGKCGGFEAAREWLNSESDILSNKEKQYLQNVIKPFQQKVKYICKSTDRDIEWIVIAIKGDVDITLPGFKKGTMYKGMEVNKDYTLTSLGLKEISAEEMFKALGYKKKDFGESIEYFQPGKEEQYIIFSKDANKMSVGAYALTKDELEACAKQKEELEV